MNNEISIKETRDLFDAESKKLENQINELLEKSELLSIPEIVEVYYLVMNVSSFIKFLEQSIESGNSENSFQDRLEFIQKLVSEQFNQKLHPKVISQLKETISEMMKSLKAAKKGEYQEKSKESVEQESQSYEKLREVMSTKEFVEQYDKGL